MFMKSLDKDVLRRFDAMKLPARALAKRAGLLCCRASSSTARLEAEIDNAEPSIGGWPNIRSQESAIGSSDQTGPWGQFDSEPALPPWEPSTARAIVLAQAETFVKCPQALEAPGRPTLRCPQSKPISPAADGFLMGLGCSRCSWVLALLVLPVVISATWRNHSSDEDLAKAGVEGSNPFSRSERARVSQ